MRDERRGLCLFEWAVLTYAALTTLLMAVLWQRLADPWAMLTGRAGAAVMTVALWQLYRRRPSRLTMVARVVGQLMLLGWWYPDTYEFNRLFLNLDHVFASWEQALFGCQPALLFASQFPSPWVSEPLCLGYVSYYPMIGAVAFYYFGRRYERLPYAAFTILMSFFLFYVIFIFLPVAGPQFYYEAVGTERIAAADFPDIGHYFMNHRESLPIPGAEGLMHTLVQHAHDAGERPTAAFPSSHVGVSVVLLWLAWEARSRWLLGVMAVLTALMFLATFYIQAHYAIDAIAGAVVGTAMYFFLKWFYGLLRRREKWS